VEGPAHLRAGRERLAARDRAQHELVPAARWSAAQLERPRV